MTSFRHSLPTIPGTEVLEMTLVWKSRGQHGSADSQRHEWQSGGRHGRYTGSAVSRVIRPGDILLEVNQIVAAKDKETVRVVYVKDHMPKTTNTRTLVYANGSFFILFIFLPTLISPYSMTNIAIPVDPSKKTPKRIWS